jgi:hypothetical protein
VCDTKNNAVSFSCIYDSNGRVLALARIATGPAAEELEKAIEMSRK